MQMRLREPIHLLVVDDQNFSRLMPGLILRPLGYCVKEASCAEEAIQMIQDSECLMVFIDIQMPGINGIKLCKWLKKSAKHRGIIRIAYTALGESLEVQHYKAVGFHHVFLKPVKSKRLINLVERCLKT